MKTKLFVILIFAVSMFAFSQTVKADEFCHIFHDDKYTDLMEAGKYEDAYKFAKKLSLGRVGNDGFCLALFRAAPLIKLGRYKEAFEIVDNSFLQHKDVYEFRDRDGEWNQTFYNNTIFRLYWRWKTEYGDLEMAAGRTENAIDAYKFALKYAPWKESYGYKNLNFIDYLNQALGDAYFKLGDDDKALSYYNEFDLAPNLKLLKAKIAKKKEADETAVNPDGTPDINKRSAAFFTAANDAEKEKNYDVVIEKLTGLFNVSKSNGNLLSWSMMSEAYYARGIKTDSKSDFQKAAEYYSNEIDLYEAKIANKTANNQTYLSLAEILDSRSRSYLRAGAYQPAYNDLKRIRRDDKLYQSKLLDNDFADNFFESVSLVYALAKREKVTLNTDALLDTQYAENLDRAKMLFAKLSEFSSTNRDSLTIYRGFAAVDQIVKLAPNFVPARKLRANLYRIEFGQYQAAIKDLNSALELEPDNQEITTLIRRANQEMKAGGNKSYLRQDEIGTYIKDYLQIFDLYDRKVELFSNSMDEANKAINEYNANNTFSVPLYDAKKELEKGSQIIEEVLNKLYGFLKNHQEFLRQEDEAQLSSDKTKLEDVIKKRQFKIEEITNTIMSRNPK